MASSMGRTLPKRSCPGSPRAGSVVLLAKWRKREMSKNRSRDMRQWQADAREAHETSSGALRGGVQYPCKCETQSRHAVLPL